MRVSTSFSPPVPCVCVLLSYWVACAGYSCVYTCVCACVCVYLADLNGRLDTWALLLSSLADIIQQQDDRPLVANAAAQTAITLLQDYNALWSEQAWQTLLTRIVPALFNAAPRGADGAPAAPAGNGVRARDVPAPRPEWVGRAQQFFPLLCGQVQSGKTKHHHELMEELAKMALLWLQQVGVFSPRL